MEHTKGKVRVISIRTNTFNSNTIYHILNENENSISHSIKECEANEQLITDAFNTTNESGLKPSELYKQNQELLDALEKSKDKISELFTKGVDFAKINSELFTILEQAINNAKTK